MSESNKVIVAQVDSAETHPDAEFSHLSVVKVLDGKTLIAGKMDDGSHRYQKGDLVVFIPVGAVIPLDLLKAQGFYWDQDKDRGLLKGNKRNRVGPVTRGSVTSEGILFPVIENKYSRVVFFVEGLDSDYVDVEEGTILNDFYKITEFKI